ncbi:MAG: sodium:solute symporter family protein [Thiolinea sp.]
MSFIDASILLAFIGYAIWQGLRSKKQASQGLEEYFLAGRSLSGWKAGISMAATQFAADTPLNVMGIMAISGIFALWQMWIYALAFLMMGFVLAASWRRVSVITDAELTEIRYGGKQAAFLRGFKAIYFGGIFNCIVLGWVFFAGAKIAEPFLPWNEWLPVGFFEFLQSIVESIGVSVASVGADDADVWVKTTNNLISILVIIFVATAYSTTGGLRSVVNTDIMQFFIMMLATLIFAVVIIGEIGGLDAMHAALREKFAAGAPGPITPDQITSFTPWDAKDVTFSMIALFAMQWLIQLNADGTGYLAQRSMACRTAKDAKIAAIVFTFAQIFLRSLLWVPIGLGLLILFPPSDELIGKVLGPDILGGYTLERELTYVRGISELLPVGVKGLMLTAMFVALASTVDTHINWGSSYFTQDIYRRFICRVWLKKEPSSRSLVWVARFSNFLIIGIALFVMTQLESINKTWQISLLLGAGMGVVLVLRWIWWRMNAWAEVGAVAVSLIASPILMAVIPDEQHFVRLLLIALISTGVALAAVYFMGPEKDERLMEFYKRAQPPGYWGPIATKAGYDPAEAPGRMWRGFAATAICAFSLFCLLIAIGSWLAGSPVPGWFPAPGAWIPTLLVVGFALCPVWWKLGFGSDAGSSAPLQAVGSNS